MTTCSCLRASRITLPLPALPPAASGAASSLNSAVKSWSAGAMVARSRHLTHWGPVTRSDADTGRTRARWRAAGAQQTSSCQSQQRVQK